MPNSNLNFQGINRAVSDYGNAGACEELINLRPTGSGLIPVKPFSIQMEGVTYDRVYVHKASSVTNYIALKKEGNDVNIYQISESGSIIGESEIGSFSIENAPNFSFSDVYFSTVGNIMLISIADKADSLFKNISYVWSSGEYKEQEANTPPIIVDFEPGEVKTAEYKGQVIFDGQEYSSLSKAELTNIFRSSMSALQEENENLCFGPFIIAIAFKTKDGETFWTNHWYLYNPLAAQKTGVISGDEDPAYIPQSDIDPEQQHDFPDGAFNFYREYSVDPDLLHRFFGTGVEVTMLINGINSDFWNKETSIIESVEIYCSKPSYYLSAEHSLLYQWADIGLGINLALSPKPFKDMEFDGFLYLQKSVPIIDLVDRLNAYSFNLKFGGSLQMTNKTLEVDAGAVTRFGDNLSYNARFHFFNSIKITEIDGVEFYFEDETIKYTTDVFIRYDDGDKEETIYLGEKTLSNAIGGAYFVIAPSIFIKEVITVDTESGNNYIRRYHLNDSERYNYSFCKDKAYQVGQGYPTDLAAIKTSQGGVGKSVFIREEPNSINVTEQYNPFVFRVEHSYLAPGLILDIQPQMVAVKDVTFGDYPLNVFTNRGLYALLQGSGTVLYGAFRPISNLVSTSQGVPTETGTFFIAAGALWLIAGTTAVLISDALSLGPHKYIRDCAGYKAISEETYDVSGLVSQVRFEEYVIKDKTRLSYNRFRDELYISNPDYDYTYVLSIRHKQWFKIGIKLSQEVIGSDIATTPAVVGKNIVNFSDEDENATPLVHLQTRPFSIGYQYVHIHRVLAMLRAALSADDMLVVGLYGSDDLQNWKLLSYASRSGVEFSQIRIPSAARSWRYYTVCVGGTTPTDTDFGTILFDYEPVVRRIG